METTSSPESRGWRLARALSPVCVVATLVGVALFGTPAHARPADVDREEQLKIAVGCSAQINTMMAIERVVVGNPAALDVVSISANELLLTGKVIGETLVTVWLKNARNPQTYLVLVSYPTKALQEALSGAFPGFDIRARAVGNVVYLSGTVNDPAVADSATRISESHYRGSGPMPEIVNLIEMPGSQQVQVQLKFAEVSRGTLREMGFHAWYRDLKNDVPKQEGGLISPAGVQTIDEKGMWASAALPTLASPISGSFAILFSNTVRMPISATLALLQSRGLAKTLSEPTLVAMSGQKASFLVGGEFPIPMPDSLGRVAVQFKNFGVQLEFVPTVLGGETVQLALTATVSNLDPSAGVTVQSVTVPGLSSRQTSTTVRMRNGQSFAIAGLLSDTMRNRVDKVPLLGDLPLIGVLFRTVSHKREETELVMMVTVNLVNPLEPNDVPRLPGEDEYSDPNDLRLFLMGSVDEEERRQDDPGPTAKQSPAGPVGFMR